MTESASTKNPVSLDALLSANREQFDAMFQRQMTGPPPAVAPVSPKTVEEPESEISPDASVPSVPVGAARENIIADLNKRFTFTWSTETIDAQIQNGRAVVGCKLNVGEQSRTETGSSRIGEEEGEAAAFARAFDKALKKCADQFPGAKQSVTPAVAAPQTPEPSAQAQGRPAEYTGPLDVVTLDRVELALRNARREMETVLLTSALSPGLRDHHAEFPMIADAQGRMIVGQFGSYIAHMLQEHGHQFAPGDVLLQSDPYLSGGAVSHLNDWMVLVPVFHGIELVGFTSMFGHVADAGGSVAGSMPADATSIFSEGMRIPPIKIFEAGALNESALELILNNTRTPDMNRVDLMAIIAGCRAGQQRVMDICDRFGPDLYRQACDGLLDRSNQAMRGLIVEHVPEEPQTFEDFVDDDGCGNGPFKLKLSVWREGDHAYFDWTGSSAQAPGPINFYLHVGLFKMFAGVYLTRTLAPQILFNDGFYELIHVTLPKGSILNPEFPAALGRRDQTLARQFDVLSGALGRHTPEASPAAGYGASPSFRYSGTGTDGRPFQMLDTLFGGLAGQPGADGMDGHSLWPDTAGVPAEYLENNFPITVESCASIADTGGAGLHRGGNGVEKVYRMLVAGAVSIHDDRHVSHPWGISGGRAGACSEKWLERPDGTRAALPSKIDNIAVEAGDRIIFRTAGGGGWGDPLDRDPALVRTDVARKLLSIDTARDTFGVVLTGAGLALDRRATGTLRDEVKRGRNSLELFDYGDPA